MREKNAKTTVLNESEKSQNVDNQVESSHVEVENIDKSINFKIKSNRAHMFNRIKEYNETLSNQTCDI